MTKSKEPAPIQEAASPSSQGRPEAELGMAPIFPPPHPFETYLFERLTTYAQGYLPLPWPHSLTLMEEAVGQEAGREVSRDGRGAVRAGARSTGGAGAKADLIETLCHEALGRYGLGTVTPIG